MSGFDFDLVTIGAGSGGVRASRMAARLGKRVAVAEESRVGGTCVMRGCVPKKLLVMGAHMAEDIADAAGFGWDVGEVSFDWGRLVSAKNVELNRLEGVYNRILRDSGVTVLEGRGTVVDAHTVEVAGKRYSAENILIATGGRPSLPKIPGIEHAITSNEALDLLQLPKSMVIVGGGYIAVEFAGIFNALGVKVTQILRGEATLRGFDQDIRAALDEALVAKGIDLRRETQVLSIEKVAGGYDLRLSGDETLRVDLVMYATGRAPNTNGLGLVDVGVQMDENGAIVVDEFSHTSVPSIWAIGDVTDRMNLTPVALAEGMALVQTLFLGNPTTVDYENVPTAVFSMPTISTVGLTEEQARTKCGCAIDVYVSRFKPMKNTLSGRDERTLMKMIVERATDRVLGIHVLGPDAAEMVQGFAVALKCGVTKAQMDSTIGIHPTAAEELVTMRDKRPDPSPECQE
ncbi:glutathione-disulfide reductase [Magnetospirillum gryphiswaldense]|uniref:Glutathione reductase n=1 Tax=Magnetospirillum gryphiswaldense TaxID=55518 RepID=A4U0Q1_9PROT|nr:glutathione-disulfide reductase [Magnetospirillum gryphiswaldense]AVM74232.1 Glutathione amide reductase [Magnetospirillum gryphiswaldense MSR-1]AVM78135.1 Glutathione amide reductase [Magnetospirillum gryphiswaldense]CAM76458.1 Glutathione reductase, plant [Magnetospirillum gryphiswaldense MSR-1]